MTVACHPLARAVQPLARRAAPDADLIARFAESRCDRAFAELVRRHGPLVLAVCRSVTRHSHDADDAFQATFLVLVRKAHTLDPARPLGAWLRGVAVRAGKKAARRRPTRPLGEVARPEPTADGEAVAAVRAAVASLPAHQRQAVERCELLGRPRAVAARELGIPPGTLSSRLALARRALAARLRRQGFAPAVVPAALLKATAAEVPSRRVVELAEAVMRTTWSGWAAGLVLAVTAAVGLAGGGVQPRRPDAPPVPAADEGRLVLLDQRTQALVWVTPAGREVRRITVGDVQAAGADLWQSLAVGGKPLVRLGTLFHPAGVLRPNGEVPLDTRKGMMLLAPTDPPTLRPLAPTKVGRGRIHAWSADGRVAVFQDGDTEAYRRIDTVTGEQTPLAVPGGHTVWDWSADGSWFLTVQSDAGDFLARLAGVRRSAGLHRVPAAGGAAEPLTPDRSDELAPRLSPDGRRLLSYSNATTDGTPVATVQWSDLDGGRMTTVSAHPKAVVVGTAWSPDGTRVAYTELRFDGPNAAGTLHLWVCDADGGGRREVPSGGTVVAWR